jgi:hypothetical protein
MSRKDSLLVPTAHRYLLSLSCALQRLSPPFSATGRPRDGSSNTCPEASRAGKLRRESYFNGLAFTHLLGARRFMTSCYMVLERRYVSKTR